MQVVRGADLGGCELHCHNVEARRGLDIQAWRQLDVAGHIKRLGDAVVRYQLVVGILIAAGVIEGIAQVQRPGRVGIHIVDISARDIFARNGMVIYPLI